MYPELGRRVGGGGWGFVGLDSSLVHLTGLQGTGTLGSWVDATILHRMVDRLCYRLAVGDYVGAPLRISGSVHVETTGNTYAFTPRSLQYISARPKTPVVTAPV